MQVNRRAFLISLLATGGSRCWAASSALDRAFTGLDRLLNRYGRTAYLFGNTGNTQFQIDYKRLRNSGDVTKLIKDVAEIPETTLQSASGDTALAFWINAHNLLVIDTVYTHWPIRGALAADREAVAHTLALGDEDYTMIQLRSKVESYNQPMALASLYAAAVGGPGLHTQSFQGSTLQSDLTVRMQAICANPVFIKIDVAAKTLTLNEWWRSLDSVLAKAGVMYSSGLTNYPQPITTLLNFMWASLPEKTRDEIKRLKPRIIWKPMETALI